MNMCANVIIPDTEIAAPAIIEGTKDLYEPGEIPPLGHVPESMYAFRDLEIFSPDRAPHRR